VVTRYADIDLAAVAAHRDRALALWYALRAVDTDGSGRCAAAQVAEAARSLGWRGRSKWRRALRAGDGVFWVRTGAGVVYLRSPARVAAALGVARIRATYRGPLRALRGSVGTVRARVVTRAVAAIRRGRPTSVAAMAAMAGISERTMQRALARTGTRRYRNDRLVAPIRSRRNVPEIAAATGEHGLSAARHRRRVWLVARLPNSLPAPSRATTHGTGATRRRVNRRLRRHTPGTSSGFGRGTVPGAVIVAWGRVGRHHRRSALVAVRGEDPNTQRVTFLHTA
jgi:hypothetical protein